MNLRNKNMKFKNEHSLVMILIKKYILIFCILCFSVNVHARNKSYNLGTEFTVSILKEDPDGVFDFIEDKIKLLSQNLVPLMYTKDFCLTSRSCRTEIDKYEFLKLLSSKAIYSFYSLRNQIEYQSLNDETYIVWFVTKKTNDEYLKLIRKLDFTMSNISNFLPLNWDYFQINTNININDFKLKTESSILGNSSLNPDIYYAHMIADRLIHTSPLYLNGLFNSQEKLVDKNTIINNGEKIVAYNEIKRALKYLLVEEIAKSTHISDSDKLNKLIINNIETSYIMLDKLVKSEHLSNLNSSSIELSEFLLNLNSNLYGELFFGVGVLGEISELIGSINQWQVFFDKQTDFFQDLLLTASETRERENCKNNKICYGSNEAWKTYNFEGNKIYIPENVYKRLNYIQSRIIEIDEKIKNTSINTINDYTFLNKYNSPNNDSYIIEEDDIYISHPPKAILKTSSRYFNINDRVIFDASDSYDLDADVIDYTWIFYTPNDSSASLVSLNKQQKYFLADVEGSYTVILKVTDGLLETQTSYSIHIKPTKKVVAESQQELIEGDITCHIEDAKQELIEGQLSCILSGKEDNRKYFNFSLPDNVEEVDVWLTGKSTLTTKTADIHISYEEKPTIEIFYDNIGQKIPKIKSDWESATDDSHEFIEMVNPRPGNYWILLYAYRGDYSDVNLSYFIKLGDSDNDKDGVENDKDVFPNDENEWADTDNDGVGDNKDDFPNDMAASLDSDLDGYPDNWNEGHDQSNSSSGLVLDQTPYDKMSHLSNEGLVAHLKKEASFSSESNILYIPSIYVKDIGYYSSYLKYDGNSLTVLKLESIDETSSPNAEFDFNSGELIIFNINILNVLNNNEKITAKLNYIDGTNPIKFKLIKNNENTYTDISIDSFVDLFSPDLILRNIGFTYLNRIIFEKNTNYCDFYSNEFNTIDNIEISCAGNDIEIYGDNLYLRFNLDRLYGGIDYGCGIYYLECFLSYNTYNDEYFLYIDSNRNFINYININGGTEILLRVGHKESSTMSLDILDFMMKFNAFSYNSNYTSSNGQDFSYFPEKTEEVVWDFVAKKSHFYNEPYQIKIRYDGMLNDIGYHKSGQIERCITKQHDTFYLSTELVEFEKCKKDIYDKDITPYLIMLDNVPFMMEDMITSYLRAMALKQ